MFSPSGYTLVVGLSLIIPPLIPYSPLLGKKSNIPGKVWFKSLKKAVFSNSLSSVRDHFIKNTLFKVVL
jgi:hypothetical protein